MKSMIDWLVNTGALDWWRGKRKTWIGRMVYRSDVRAVGRLADAAKELKDAKRR